METKTFKPQLQVNVSIQAVSLEQALINANPKNRTELLGLLHYPNDHLAQLAEDWKAGKYKDAEYGVRCKANSLLTRATMIKRSANQMPKRPYQATIITFPNHGHVPKAIEEYGELRQPTLFEMLAFAEQGKKEGNFLAVDLTQKYFWQKEDEPSMVAYSFSTRESAGPPGVSFYWREWDGDSDGSWVEWESWWTIIATCARYYP